MNPTDEELRNGFDIQGAKNIFLAKKKIMAGYRFAQELGNDRPVRTEHGNSGEALLRQWLRDFLPGKYGVTSGYVISTFYTSKQKIRHYDVIIYDKLNSPVLWRDDSSGEERLAIPAEYTLAVLEVKSKFNTSSTRQAIDKLRELRPLWLEVDDPTERYKKYLPPAFFCATVFFEYSEDALFSKVASSNLNWIDGERYIGGLVIEASDSNDGVSTRISLSRSKTYMKNEIYKGGHRINSGMFFTESVRVDKDYQSATYLTGTNIFTEFAFDLLALLNGTYQVGMASSFHGLRFGIKEEL